MNDYLLGLLTIPILALTVLLGWIIIVGASHIMDALLRDKFSAPWTWELSMSQSRRVTVGAALALTPRPARRLRIFHWYIILARIPYGGDPTNLPRNSISNLSQTMIRKIYELEDKHQEQRGAK